jgi:hypothetical protein
MMKVAIGKGIELDVPAFTGLSPEVQEHIIRVGWRNLLMDAHAGITVEKAEAKGMTAEDMSREAAVRKLEALTRGELRTAPLTDPVAREAYRLAAAGVKAAAKDKGLELTAAELRTKATANLGKFMAKARKNLKEQDAIEVEL